MSNPNQVVAFGGFDDIRSRDVRFQEEASKLGVLTVIVWPDKLSHQLTGVAPKLPVQERVYFLNSLRYVDTVVELSEWSAPDSLPQVQGRYPQVWVDGRSCANAAREEFCTLHGISYAVLNVDEFAEFPEPRPISPVPGKKRVVVSGSYDWLHSGHIRFFEEASGYGDLYAVVGHDANIRLLKGPGHPLLSQDERRYMVSSVKYVKQALISSGSGWLDADPEIRHLQPHF